MIHHSPPKPIVVTCQPQLAAQGTPVTYSWSCSTIIKGKKVKVLVLFQEPDNLVMSPPVPPMPNPSSPCPAGQDLVKLDQGNGDILLKCEPKLPAFEGGQ